MSESTEIIIGQPITRRQALQHIALVTGGSVMAGGLLAACGQTGAKQQSAPSLSPTPRNQTVFVDQAQFTTFDSCNPFTPNGQQYNAGLYQTCEEFLFYYNLVTGEMKPWLAQSWQYNADHTQLTLNLNPAAHWNDGTPFTSKDVQFTLELLLKNPTLINAPSYTPFVKNVSSPDDHTVVIALNAPNPRFHYNFVCGIASGQDIVPAHIWSGQNPLSFKDNPPVRTGPYKLDRVIEAQNMFIWKKDPNYWNKSNFDPKPEYIVYRYQPLLDSEVEEFKRGQVDIPYQIDYTHAVAIQNSGYKNIVIEQKFRDPCPRAIAINCDPSKGLLADPRMHWAISYLIDRKLLASTVWTLPTVPAQYPWADYPANDKWSAPDVASQYPLTYDPAKATALLDEMGAKVGSGGKRYYQGQPLQYEIMTSVQPGQPEYIIGQKLADELGKVGIGATVKYYEGTVWQDKFNNGQFDISTYYICGNVFDPGQLYTQFETSKTAAIGKDASAGQNYYRSRYSDLNNLAVQIDNIDPNSASAKTVFDEALAAYYKDLPLIPSIQTTYPSFFNTTYWTGWPTDENLYQIPSDWWGQFLFVFGNLKPTGQA